LLGLPVNYLTLPTLIYRRLSSFGPGRVCPTSVAVAVLVGVVAALGIVAAALAARNQRGKVEIERPLPGRTGCSAPSAPLSPPVSGCCSR
jgi:iron(III) transport system permease protein